MNKSGLSDKTVITLIDKTLGAHDIGVWHFHLSEHTDHTGETFPCINDFGWPLDNHNVVIENKGSKYCSTHQREATHVDNWGPCCDPSLGGITMPCRVGDSEIPSHITCSSPGYMKMMDEQLRAILSSSSEDLGEMLLKASKEMDGAGPSVWLMEHIAHILMTTPFLDEEGKPII